MRAPYDPNFYKFTDADIPALKGWFAEHPVFLGPTLARAAEAKGFVEGVHFRVNRPIVLEPYQALVGGSI